MEGGSEKAAEQLSVDSKTTRTVSKSGAGDAMTWSSLPQKNAPPRLKPS